MEPLTWVYLLIGLLLVGVAILLILYMTGSPPFNQPYKPRDPRTWKSVENNQVWLKPDFDYGPYARSEPSSEIIEIYNGLLTALGKAPIVY